MTVSTSYKTVTFTRLFVLSGIDGVQPAGTYTVETDEELPQTLSFPAYQRTATWIRLPLQPSSVRFVAAGSAQVVNIDFSELEAALARDAASAPGSAAEASLAGLQRSGTTKVRRPSPAKGDQNA